METIDDRNYREIANLRDQLAAKDREIEQLRAFLSELPAKIRDSGKPGPGGVDITGGIPSEVYVAIGRERYDDEYEVAEATAEAMRNNMASYLERLIKEPRA